MGRPANIFDIIYDITSKEDNVLTVSELCQMCNVSRSGYYRWIKAEETRKRKEEKDREDFDLSHIENSLYLGKNGNYITLGHIWDTQPIDIYGNEDKDTHEFTAGAGLRLTKRINVRESVVYNAYEHIIQRHSGGIYYEHPCYYFSLEYQRDNAERRDYVGNTTFQFKFGISIDGKHY